MLPTATLLALSTLAIASTPPVRAARSSASSLAAASSEVASASGRGSVSSAAPPSSVVVRWRRPVPGAVARPFSYGSDRFRAGWHRGADFVASAGTPVRAACSGVVATARPGLVTLRCGPWRVTHLPLASVSVAEGSFVRAGRVVGAVGTNQEHAGLHLGVRRAGDRFAYVDPVPFLADRPAPPPTAAPPRTTRIPRTGPARPTAPPAIDESRPASVPASPPGWVFASPPAAVAALPPAPSHTTPEPRVRVSSPAGERSLAPWPAWVGLGLLLIGVVGGGVRVRVRRHRAGVSAPVPSAR